MYDDIHQDHTPSHVQMARDKNGMSLVDLRGADLAGTVKLARWAGRLDNVHTTPRDDYHTICLHYSGGSSRSADMPNDILTPGTVFLQPAENEGIFNSDAPIDYYHLYFPVEAYTTLVEEIDTPLARGAVLPVEFGCRDKEFTQRVAGFVSDISRADNPSGIEFDEWTLEIGMTLLRYAARAEDHALTGSARSSLSHREISRVVDYIETRLGSRITLADLSELCGISQFRFMRAFKAETGFNPHQYVMERRVARSKTLLQEGDTPIADIAYDIGFSSQAHMTDVFRKRVGATPGQFRRIMRG
ncbi:MAG: AraC family transcriptional regulator [Pseudomonadota bacterium]